MRQVKLHLGQNLPVLGSFPREAPRDLHLTAGIFSGLWVPLSQLSAFPGSPQGTLCSWRFRLGQPHLVRAPTPCLCSQHVHPALCAFSSFPALLLPAGLPGQPLEVPVPLPSLERSIFPVMGRSALPTLAWAGFGPSWGGHSLCLCLPPSAPGSHPSPAPPAPDRL